MLSLTSIATTISSGEPSDGEVADRLRHAVFEQLERGLLQAGDESPVIGDDRGDLHDVDRHFLDLIEALGARAGDDAAAADQVGDDAQARAAGLRRRRPTRIRPRSDRARCRPACRRRRTGSARRACASIFGRISALSLVMPLTYESGFRRHHADRQFRRVAAVPARRARRRVREVRR